MTDDEQLTNETIVKLYQMITARDETIEKLSIELEEEFDPTPYVKEATAAERKRCAGLNILCMQYFDEEYMNGFDDGVGAYRKAIKEEKS